MHVGAVAIARSSRTIQPMRRVHVPAVTLGDLALNAEESHHLANVLRVIVGETIELFDSSGVVGLAQIEVTSPVVRVRVLSIVKPELVRELTVAAAVPKNDRAEWMIEKLTEIGVTRFIPLRTRHSVVHPDGSSKLQRWERIAVEAAKQSHRVGVMRIDTLTPLSDLLRTIDSSTTLVLSTSNARPLPQVALPQHAMLLIGPEGGWSVEEMVQFQQAGIVTASLGATILRIETAALVGAAALMIRE